jgi:hypothetical protein
LAPDLDLQCVEQVLTDPGLVSLLSEGDHMRAIAEAFRNNPSKAVRDGQKLKQTAESDTSDTERFMTALAEAQTRMEYDEECAILDVLEDSRAAAEMGAR